MSTKSSESAPRSGMSRLSACTTSGLRKSRSATNWRMNAKRPSRLAGGAAVSDMARPPVAKHDGGVLPAEAERRRQHVLLVVRPGVVRHVVEVAGGVGVVEVDGRVDPAPLHAGDRGHGLDRPRG